MLELCRCPNIYGPDCIIQHVIYMDRGEGDTVESQSMLAISCIKAHGTQCFGGEHWENMTEMMIFGCIAVQAAVQLRATNAAV